MSSTANSRMFLRVSPNTYNPILGGFIILKDHKPPGPYKEILFKDKATIAQEAAVAEAEGASQEEAVAAALEASPNTFGPFTITPSGTLVDTATVTFSNAKGIIVPETEYTIDDLDDLVDQLGTAVPGIGDFAVDDEDVVISNGVCYDLECTIVLS